MNNTLSLWIWHIKIIVTLLRDMNGIIFGRKGRIQLEYKIMFTSSDDIFTTAQMKAQKRNSSSVSTLRSGDVWRFNIERNEYFHQSDVDKNFIYWKHLSVTFWVSRRCPLMKIIHDECESSLQRLCKPWIRTHLFLEPRNKNSKVVRHTIQTFLDIIIIITVMRCLRVHRRSRYLAEVLSLLSIC